MPLLSLIDATFGYSSPPLLDAATVRIDRGERIGLVGRNGAGKTTLMRILMGEIDLDGGELQLEPEAHVARLEQDVPAGLDCSVFAHVARGLLQHGELVAAYGALLEAGMSEEAPERQRLETELSVAEAWDDVQQVKRTLQRMQLEAFAHFASLSSGMKRRVCLARALVSDPDLLLLDEPTNHLDIPTIDWLERFLEGFRGTLLFVTHDRVFLQKLATRIVEIDRGRLFDWECDYETFLKRRDAQLEAEARQNAAFDKKLAEEERWIRQGIKARRTRNEGRVRALQKLREVHRARRQRDGKVRMQVQDVERSGQLVLEAKNISFAYDGHTVFEDFSTVLMRGDKVGVIGPNGAGKTTLLRVLLGELEPTAGRIRRGTNLQVAYFDQQRAQLDEEQTAVENVGQGAATVRINGQTRHVLGYLQDFLFTPERARTLVRYLSGGERNRLLLAMLLSKPANVLVLDEPTNDLDAETLELLEELLADYAGTLLVVSHDRAFLNNVVTNTLVFEGAGQVKEYDGGYDDWVRQSQGGFSALEARCEPLGQASASSKSPACETRPGGGRSDSSASAHKPDDSSKKLSYKESRELESLPETIAELEAVQDELHSEMQQPEFYREPEEHITQTHARLQQLQQQLEAAYARWEELEGR